MRLIHKREKTFLKAVDALQPEQVRDPVIELRRSFGLIREYIRLKVEAGAFMTALQRSYYLRSVEQGVLPPNVGQEALVNLKQRVVELEQAYLEGDPQFINARLSFAADQVTDALAISAQFPELLAETSVAIAPAVNRVVEALEHSTEFGNRSAIRLMPAVVFSLQFVDIQGRGKDLVKTLEGELIDEWLVQTKKTPLDQDALGCCLMNGMYLRILYPERDGELTKIMQQLPSLQEDVLKETNLENRFLLNFLLALPEAHQMTTDEHGQVRVKLREPAIRSGPTLPHRQSL